MTPIRAAAGAPGRQRGCRLERSLPAQAAIPVLAVLAATAIVAAAGPAGAQVAGPASGTAGAAPATQALTAAWGENSTGQLGFTTTGSFSPVPGPVGVPAGMKVAKVAGGCSHGIAATTAGQILTWGNNALGQLGHGKQASTSDPAPQAVTLPAGARPTSVAAGCSFSLALTSNGQVFAWGDNSSGQVGAGSVGGAVPSPVRVQLPAGVRATAISAGDNFSLALTAGGQVYAWGSNSEGQLGSGAPHGPAATGMPRPVRLPRFTRVTRITAGGDFALALAGAGRVLAWGDNQHGTLGNGTTDSSPQPAPVQLPFGARAIDVTAGQRHGVALLSTGQLLAWGDNFDGQLGDGTIQGRLRPVRVSLPAGTRVTAVAAGEFHNVAITATGQVLGWGDNNSGQVGDGTTVNRPAPVPVPLDVPAVKQLQARGSGTTALVIGSGPDSDSSYVAYLKVG